MVTITVHCPHCQSDALVRNGYAPMANSSLAAMPADGKAARISLPTPIRKLAARESCMPIKNAAVYAASPARLASRVRPCRLGSKKVAQLPPLWTTLLAPDPEDPTSTTLEPYRLWSFVLKKANDSWMWMALCRQTRQVVAYAVGDRSPQDVSAIVGGHSRGISPRALLQRLLGGLQGSNARRTTLRCGQRDRRNRSCRAVEQHLAPTSGPFCAHDVIVFPRQC